MTARHYPLKPAASAIRLVLSVAFLMTASAAANAEATPSNAVADNYVYFGGFYLDADKGRTNGKEQDSFGYTAAIGHRLSENLWIEGQYFGDTIETGVRGATDFYQNGFGVDLKYGFGNPAGFNPYVLAGVGGVYDDIATGIFPASAGDNGKSKLSAYGNLAAGFTQAILGYENLRLRGEIRGIYDDFQGGRTDLRATIGLEIGLQKPKAPEVVIREVPVEKIVIREVPVEKVVIREAPVVVAPVDGDDDGDGVPNSRDKCPNTLRGARVDANGCVIEQTLTIRDITFEFNSARLTANAQRLMENVVSFLRSDPTARIDIAGHTDNVGGVPKNLVLSRARAKEVRDYLIGYGIDGSRLHSEGYGKSRPIATNSTAAGRELNRRVEFHIQK